MHVKERGERKTCPTTCPSGSLRASLFQGLHRRAFPCPRWKRRVHATPLRANSFNRCGARLRLTGLGRPPLNRVFRRASQSREDWACKDAGPLPRDKDVPSEEPRTGREVQGTRRVEYSVALFFRLFSFGQAKEIGS